MWILTQKECPYHIVSDLNVEYRHKDEVCECSETIIEIANTKKNMLKVNTLSHEYT